MYKLFHATSGILHSLIKRNPLFNLKFGNSPDEEENKKNNQITVLYFSVLQEKWYHFQRQGGCSCCAEKHRRGKSQRGHSSDDGVRKRDKSTEDLEGSRLHFEACKQDSLATYCMCRSFINNLRLKSVKNDGEKNTRSSSLIKEGVSPHRCFDNL